MNTLSTNSADNRLIKSWFGFFLGMFAFGINIMGLLESLSTVGVLRSLAFLCFWYLWSQMTGWNRPITKFFVNETEDQKASGLSLYLPFIALILLTSSFILEFI